MSGWNGLDFFIFLILVLNLVLGMSRGGFREAISLMCLSIALIFAIKFTIPLANLMNKSPLIVDVVDSEMFARFMTAIDAGPLTEELLRQINYSLSLLICFVGAFSICEAALNMTGFLEAYGLATALINRKVGAALGLARGYIITLVFLSILALHLNPGFDSSIISGSYFARLFSNQTKYFDQLISSQDVDNYYKLYDKQNIQPEEIYKVLKKPDDSVIAPQQTPTNTNSDTTTNTNTTTQPGLITP